MNNLDQMTIDDYFREFSHFHVKKATELLQPLHVPGQDPLPDFSEHDPPAVRAPGPRDRGGHQDARRDPPRHDRRGVRDRQNADGNADHPPARPAVGPQGRLQRQLPGDRALPRPPVKKWQAELEETIPGVKVTMFDVAGKGCKHLISDMTRLYDRMKGPSGRWKKPQGAEWYILGRDQAKFLPAR